MFIGLADEIGTSSSSEDSTGAEAIMSSPIFLLKCLADMVPSKGDDLEMWTVRPHRREWIFLFIKSPERETLKETLISLWVWFTIATFLMIACDYAPVQSLLILILQSIWPRSQVRHCSKLKCAHCAEFKPIRVSPESSLLQPDWYSEFSPIITLSSRQFFSDLFSKSSDICLCSQTCFKGSRQNVREVSSEKGPPMSKSNRMEILGYF